MWQLMSGCVTSREVCEVWHESQHAGFFVGASVTLGSPRLRRLFSSRFSIMSTRRASLGGHKRSSLLIFGSPGSRSTKRSRGLGIAGSSSSMRRVDRVALPVIGSVMFGVFNLSRELTCCGRQTCRVSGATLHPATCRVTWLEGIKTYVRRSAGLAALVIASPVSTAVTVIEITKSQEHHHSGRAACCSTLPRRGTGGGEHTSRPQPAKSRRADGRYCAASRRRWLITGRWADAGSFTWPSDLKTGVYGDTQRNHSTRVKNAFCRKPMTTDKLAGLGVSS